MNNLPTVLNLRDSILGVDTAGQGALLRAPDGKFFNYDNAHDETEEGELLLENTMVDVVEEAQISSHGEIGGLHNRVLVSISKLAPDMLKPENISGCGFEWSPHGGFKCM